MKHNIVTGADIGGSHITVGLVDLQQRRLISSQSVRKSVNSHGSAESIIATWASAITELFQQENQRTSKIGIGIPGPMDYDNGVSLIKDQDKYDALYGLNVKSLLAEEINLKSSDIKLINDAGCFLQGEAFAGAASGYNHAIGVMLGTGLGTARYHNALAEDANLWCSPFKESIAEDYLSTRWFSKRFKELTGKEIANVKELADIADSDAMAKLIFEEFGENLGLFLNDFIRRENADIVICGGNISRSFNLFSEAMNYQLQKNGSNVPVKMDLLGEESAILGAASCWDLNSNFRKAM